MKKELILHPLFQDGVILQRGIQIPVTGKAEPHHLIRADLCGHSVFTKSSGTGAFRLNLPPMKEGGAYEMTVRDLNTEESVTIRDIMIGEVWLASGQSNMDYRLNTNWAVESPEKTFQQKKEFCDTLKDPETFRFFEVNKSATATPMEECHGSWKYMNRENAPEASAVASWFGRKLRDGLNVPVGIILSAWGGTRIESWTSREALLQNPETADLVRSTDEQLREKNIWKTDYKNTAWHDFTQEDPGNKGVEHGWAELNFDDSDWKDMKIPGSWIQQKIAGHGAVWFRKTVEIPEHWIGKPLTLSTGGIDKHDTAYFNGVETGKTGRGFEEEFWNQKRNYLIAPELVNSGEAVISIRVYSFINDGGFGGSTDDYKLHLSGTGEFIDLSGIWKACSEFDMGIRIRPIPPLGPENPQTPGILFDDMIRPLIPFPVRGVIWYQGESNAPNPAAAATYKRKMETLIRDWRFRWGIGDFPFIQVQLAGFFEKNNYDHDSAWAVLRNMQRCVCNEIPEVYLTTAVDLGDKKDIHPQDKRSVGERLAANALFNVYHLAKYVPSGPLCKNCFAEGNSLRISFDHAECLNLKPDAVRSFYLAGQDRLFYQADKIEIKGGSVIVSSTRINQPQTVRYAWANFPESVLFNGNGLPAPPFEISLS